MAEDAWRNNDSAPMQDVQGVGEDNNGWGNGAGSPRGGGGRTPPPRRSRSRSPGRGRGPPPNNNTDGSTNPGNNLHVSGLSSRVDNRQLEELFAKYGRVQKAAVMYDPHTRESRGFGFVTMETGEEADAAVSALSGTEFMGKPLSLEKARRGRARTPTPGRYFGPPKRGDRPYEPRGGYDSRGGPPPDRRGGYGGGPDRGGYGGRDDDRRRGYDDRRDYDRGGRYDDRRPYDDRRDYDRGGRYEDRGGRYDDRRYDDRRPAPPPAGAR